MYTSLDAHEAVKAYKRSESTLMYMHVPVVDTNDKLADIVARYNKVGVLVHAWSSHPYGFDIYYTHSTEWSTEMGCWVPTTRAQKFKPDFIYDLPYEGDK